MKINGYIFGLAVAMLLHVTPAFAILRICQTHETCRMEQVCQCRIPANFTSYSYYYSNIQGLAAHHAYRCSLQSTPSMLRFDKNGSLFPEGSQLTCVAPCSVFPLSFTLVTNGLVEPSSTMVLRYYVPAGDVPFDFTVSCQIVFAKSGFTTSYQ